MQIELIASSSASNEDQATVSFAKKTIFHLSIRFDSMADLKCPRPSMDRHPVALPAQIAPHSFAVNQHGSTTTATTV